jgi:hypothetical protein
VLHRMNFESPYVDMPMRLTVRQNLTVFGQLYAVREYAPGASAVSPPSSISTEFLDPRRQAIRRAKNPRGAGQGADQPAGSYCCSTSRPPRSIPTPPTGSGSI